MNDQTETTVRSAIQQLYANPLTDFISRRDALAKELRSAGDREAASMVKGLRKPSRPAWALNRVADQSPESLEALDRAVANLVDAHAGKGEARAAMSALRDAVRECAALAAGESRSGGFNLDVGGLSNAILAVLGHPTSYEAFRGGRITEIPEAGGLDFLTSLPARSQLEVSVSGKAAPRPHVDSAEVAAAREQARLAAETLDTARAAAEAAASVLVHSDAEVATAQESVRLAEAELKAAQQRREFARRSQESTSAELRKAEAASHEAERRLRSL